jgi:membrane-bound metal-dependent hydrolase YbcI (DUF457 family)
MVSRPKEPERPERPSHATLLEFWTLFAVLLAYAPDVCGQVLQFAGWGTAPLFCHSLLFAAAIPILFGLGLRVAGIPWRRGFLVALFSIVLHDALDIAQATDKVPFWPFSERPVSLGAFSIPSGMLEEILLFGGGFMVFLLIRRLMGRPVIFVRGLKADPSPHARRIVVIHRILLAAIVLLVVATHSLRDHRERQLDSARALIEGGWYADGRMLLEASDRWPSTAKAGRTDYLRGVASLGEGERDKAEAYFLKSFRADPTYLWVVVDLANLYADSPHPIPVRKRLVSPYLETLRRDFRNRKEASDAAERIEALMSPGARSR